jgi:transcriptional regulator with XRE-family HTH domain
MPKPDFPARVRSERQRIGWTQEDAASALDMSREQYKKLEDSPRDIRMSTLVRLVRAGFQLGAIAPDLTKTEC